MKKQFKQNQENAIKIAKAIMSLRKHTHVNRNLLQNRLKQEGLEMCLHKERLLFNHLITTNVLKKDRGRVYFWNGNQTNWSNIDYATNYVKAIFQNNVLSTAQPKKVLPQPNTELAKFNAEELVAELRNRGWEVECKRFVMI